MQHRSTFTIDEENFAFLKSVAGSNLSAYINSLLVEKKQSLLAEEMLRANKEESEASYLKNVQDDWDVTLFDGLNT